MFYNLSLFDEVLESIRIASTMNHKKENIAFKQLVMRFHKHT